MFGPRSEGNNVEDDVTRTDEFGLKVREHYGNRLQGNSVVQGRGAGSAKNIKNENAEAHLAQSSYNLAKAELDSAHPPKHH